MNIVLWVLQIALAFLCISGGTFQIFKFDELRKGVVAMQQLPKGLWAVLGVIGVLAGLGLILPGLLGLGGITAYAALTMVLHSLLVSGFYLHYGDRAPVPYSLVMAGLAAFIAYGRFALGPV